MLTAACERGLFCAGVDVGSLYSKAVVVDSAGWLRGHSVLPTGLDLRSAGAQALQAACAQAGVRSMEVASVVSAGYGRDDVEEAGRTRSEILCLARGAFALFSRAMTVADIGGQDSKLIFVDGAGKRTDYRMNRKCAAGTGAFLEMICLRLGLRLEQLAALAESTREIAPLSSFCSVFAATEVLDLCRRGYKLEAVARGVYHSVARRLVEMGLVGPFVALAGGVVAHHPVLAELLREVTSSEVVVLPLPQHVGALGAALLALEGVKP